MFNDLGIALYDGGSETVEAVSLYRRGYYGD